MIDKETLHMVRSKAGRKGGIIGGNRFLELYPGKLQSQAKLASKAYVKKYGIEFLRESARKISKVGGFAAAEKSEPTIQMRRCIIQNIILNLDIGKDFEINQTMKNGDEAHNVDFVYFKNEKILFIEEVTSIIPYNKIFFAKVLELVELKNWLYSKGFKVPVLFNFIREKKDSTKTLKKVSFLALFSLFENGIIPIFDDNKRKLIIRGLLKGKYPMNYMVRFKDSLIESLKEKLVKHRSFVIAMKGKDMTESERKVHEKLMSLGMKPKGKTIIENQLGLLMEIDNCYEFNKEKWLVLVTKSNSKKIEILANHAKQHAGLAFIIKTMFNSSYKILSVILTDGDLGTSKWVKYLNRYSDKVINKIDNLGQ